MYSFSNKAEFGEIVRPDLKQYGGRLILYGAGKVAEVVDYVLRQRGIEYLCFCDTYRAGGTHCGHPVISPEELERDYPGVPVLITTIHHRSIVELLEAHKPREILDSVPLLVDVDFSGWGKTGERMTEEWAVRTITSYLITMLSAQKPVHFQELTVYLTQKCNLRCLDCSAMVPYYVSPKHYEPEIITRSLENLLSYAGVQFHEISLLGGETLLYPDLEKVLEFSLSISKNEQVSIVTNGTLIPKENLIPLMQHPRFFARISDYGTLSIRKRELIEFFEKNNIKYELDNYVEWYENRQHLIDPCSEEEAARKYKACTEIKYRVLSNGFFFPCCKAAHLCQLGIFHATPENSIDCLTPDGLHERLRVGLQRFEEGSHIDICHRCYGTPQIHPDKMVSPAVQTAGLLHLL